MPNRAKKRARNHTECVAEFRRLGCTVEDLGSVGQGVPDLLVGMQHFFLHTNLLVEIKDGDKAKLTPAQRVWHSEWKGQVCVVRNLEDVRKIVKQYQGE